MLPISIAIVGADYIVIADHEHRPARGGIDGRNLLAEFRGRELIHVCEQEVHGQLQFVVAFAIVLV